MSTWIPYRDTSYYLWSRKVRDGRWWAGLYFNPSRILTDDPLYIATVLDVATALDRVWPQLTSRVEPVDEDWRAARVRRLDVARDFDVDHTGRALESLVHIPRKHAKQVYTHYHPNTTVISSITIRTSKAGRVGGNRTGQHVKLYDKGVESGQPDLQRIRWEARCQDWAGRIGGIFLARDLTNRRVAKLLVERWDWSCAGMTMASTVTLVDAVISMGLNSTTTRALIGDACLREAGREVTVAEGTCTRRDKLLRELDHVLSRPNPYPFGSRLDLELGREVPVADPAEVARPPPADGHEIG